MSNKVVLSDDQSSQYLLYGILLSIKSNYLQECLAFYVFTNCHYSSRKYK